MKSKIRTLREGIRWGTYDFANSAYFLVFGLYLLPTYLHEIAKSTGLSIEGAWGIAQGLAVLTAVVLGLILSKWVDRIGLIKCVSIFVLSAPLLSYLIPVAIYFKAPINAVLGIFIVVHSMFLLSITAYDATLTLRSNHKGSRVAISAWGWGWGYMGGVACLLLTMLRDDIVEKFLIGSTFYLIFSLLAIRTFKLSDRQIVINDIDRYNNKSHEQPIISWKMRTSILWRMMIVVEGIAIFMGFTTLFARNVVLLSDNQIQKLLLLLQLLAFPLTGLIVLTLKMNVKNILISCGIIWFVVSVQMCIWPTIGGFVIATILVAGCVGSTQSTLRSAYTEYVSVGKPMSGFSIYAVVEKGAAFIGPAIGGVLIQSIGYIPVFIMAGGLILIGCTMTALYYRDNTNDIQTHLLQ